MMNYNEANKLLIKYRIGQCTEAEKKLVEDAFFLFNEHDLEISKERIEQIGEEVYYCLPDTSSRRNTTKLWSVISAVASISLVGIGVLMFYQKNETVSTEDKTLHDIPPGSNKATLALSNGKTIGLDSSKAGVIIDAGKLAYSDGTAIENSGLTGGTQMLTTPNGGQYQLILKDGTKIWLNSASTLTFKTSPSYLATREVSLSGEAYFEIAKDKDRPFRVLSKGQVIEVLGTHFSINAYKEESITKTTLLEGSIKINNSIVLTPGQQSINISGKLTVKEADLSLETAWKSGKIQFEDADLKTVMNMLARWYDIHPQYDYYPAESRFTGSISRYKNISEVLKLLESTNEVHFKIAGRRVTTIR